MDVLKICTSGAGIESLFPGAAQYEVEDASPEKVCEWLRERDQQVLLHDYCTLVYMDELLTFLGINIAFQMYQNTRQCHQPATGDVYLVAEYQILKTRPRLNGRDEINFVSHLVTVK